MKITILQGAFLPVPPLMGGAVEKVWHALGQRFAREGHTVTHLSRRHPDLPMEEVVEGVRHLRVRGFPATNNPWLLKFRDLRYTLRALRAAPPADILVTHTFWAPILHRWFPQTGRCYVHAARFPKGQMRFYGTAARLQTVSSPVAEAILDEIGPGQRNRVQSIPYPVHLPAAFRDFQSRPPAKPLRLLYVGRIHPEKGVHLILEALRGLDPDHRGALQLDLVGPDKAEEGGGGPAYLKNLQALAADIHPAVRFYGPVYDSDALNDHYRAADLFLYPSLADRGETFGLAVLEAMANGLPVLVSANPCFLDFVQPGHSGFVFDHRADAPAEALAALLEKILQEPEQLPPFGGQARSRAEEFTEEKIARRYLQDFESLLVPSHAGT